jgi:hypothetical protein
MIWVTINSFIPKKLDSDFMLSSAFMEYYFGKDAGSEYVLGTRSNILFYALLINRF